MSGTFRKSLMLLLCLLLFACLLPAAFADGVSDLQAAINSFNSTGTPKSYTVTAEIDAGNTQFTIPNGFTLTLQKKLMCGGLTIQAGGEVVVNGVQLNTRGGPLTLDGTLELNGGVYVGNASNFGALYNAYEANPKRLITSGNWMYNAFRGVDDGSDFMDAINEGNRIVNYFGVEHAAANVQIYFDAQIPSGAKIDVYNVTLELDQTMTIQGKLEALQFNTHPGSQLILDGGSLTAMGDNRPYGFNIAQGSESNNGASVTIKNGGQLRTRMDAWENIQDAISHERLSMDDNSSILLKDGAGSAEDAANLFTRSATILSASGTKKIIPYVKLKCDYAIPLDTTVNVGMLEVTSGKTLTVSGVLNVLGRIELDGGNLAVPGHLNTNLILVKCEDEPENHLPGVTGYSKSPEKNSEGYYVFYKSNDALTGLRTALESGAATYTLTGDVTIPNEVTLRGQSTKIIVPANVTLTINGRLDGPEYEIQANGSIVDNGNMGCNNLTVNGTLTLNNTWADVGADSYDRILAATNNNRITYNGNAGFNLYHGVTTDTEFGNAISRANTIVEALGDRALPVVDVKYACSIPADTSVNARNARIQIRNSLTVNGKLEAKELNIDKKATVTVDGGELGVPGTIYFGGTMEVSNTWIDIAAIGVNNLEDALKNKKIIFTGDAGVNLHRGVTNEEEALSEWGAIVGAKQIMERLYDYRHNVQAIVDLMCEVSIPQDTHMQAGGGVISVHGGAALIVYGELSAHRIKVENGGDLVIRGGTLNTSNIKWRTLPSVDLTLPGNLQTLEDAALADGTFTSVYIPPTTEAIADNAFGDRDSLRIIGVNGSLAGAFAAEKGYDFVPVTGPDQ